MSTSVANSLSSSSALRSAEQGAVTREMTHAVSHFRPITFLAALPGFDRTYSRVRSPLKRSHSVAISGILPGPNLPLTM
jgi:hypothetical protein